MLGKTQNQRKPVTRLEGFIFRTPNVFCLLVYVCVCAHVHLLGTYVEARGQPRVLFLKYHLYLAF